MKYLFPQDIERVVQVDDELSQKLLVREGGATLRDLFAAAALIGATAASPICRFCSSGRVSNENIAAVWMLADAMMAARGGDK